MLSFENDYIKGAHPKVLEALFRTNDEALSGYGSDSYCQRAKEKIRTACLCPAADVYFLMGGTQMNAVVISSLLRSYEGVIAASSGHISFHEAGAIEATGHKVLELAPEDGKIPPHRLEAYLQEFFADENREHRVFPGMVYLSHPTETGSIYKKAELTAISDICHRYGIPLYLDGARLGYGLMSHSADLTLSDIAALCDVFYIGGTKMGTLCGEALVFPRGNAPSHYISRMKQSGALLAKGRLLGVQFDALFSDGLYLELGAHGIAMAEELKAIFREKGYTFAMESQTNQQFILLETQRLSALREKVAFSVWEPYNARYTVVRFVTAWSTTKEELDALRNLL